MKRGCAEIVHPYAFNPRLLGPAPDFSVHIAFSNGKYSVIWPYSVEHIEVGLHFFNEKFRHGYDTVAFLSFGACDQVFSFQPLVLTS